MRVLITGAGGFIGRSCVDRFILNGWKVRAVSRQTNAPREGLENISIVDPLTTDWQSLLNRVDYVLHLAGVAHQPNALQREYDNINVGMTERLAYAAIASGVKRFVFLSSVAVYGRNCGRMDENTPLNPVDMNGWTKALAESRLQKIANSAAMEWAIVRPPLVYGPGAPGNFSHLASLVRRGVPLPLLAAREPRSLISVNNLVDALLCVVLHPDAANRTYLVSDGDDRCTADLINLMSAAVGRTSRLWWLPECSLRMAAALIGREVDAERILGCFQLNISAIRNELGWAPVISTQDGIAMAMRNTSMQTAYQNKD